jgi:cytochrome c oxidase subunit II
MTVTMFVTRAAGFIGRALLLAFFVAVTQAREMESPRTIDVTLARYAFSPERIEVRVGERVCLNVVSVDRAHGFRVKGLGLDVRTPTRGRTVTVEVTPKEAGTFQIDCSEYCGSGHTRMKAWLIVTPGT